MAAINSFQLSQKHDPPFSTDHPIRLDNLVPQVQCDTLTEIAFKQRCALKDRAYKFIRTQGGLDNLPDPFPKYRFVTHDA